MHSKKHVIAAAPLLLSLAAFTQEATAVSDINACQTLNKSGSFRLTKSLNAKGDCIVIAASDVNLDLRGHTIKGNGTGTGIGFRPDPDTVRARVSVRNGVVTNFRVGIDLTASFMAVIEGMQVGGEDINMEQGILAGTRAIVRDNIALLSTPLGDETAGIRTLAQGLMSGNVVSGALLMAFCPALVTGNSISSGARIDIVKLGQGCLRY